MPYGCGFVGRPVSDENKAAASLLEIAPALGWLWLLVMAIWGGTVGYMRKVMRKKRPFLWREMFLEWVISAFAGIVTAYLCVWAGMPFTFTAAAAGISGHLGGAAIDIWEARFRKGAGG